MKRDVPLPVAREAVLPATEAGEVAPVVRPVPHLLGGYPGALPPDPTTSPSPDGIATPQGPAWEQAALRVFQGLNDPLPPSSDGSAPRRRSRERR